MRVSWRSIRFRACGVTTRWESTAQSFEFGRDWYGRVRGSDGIFSFHPFSHASISFNGIGQAVSMRPELLEANVLERYDPGRHPRHVYQRLE